METTRLQFIRYTNDHFSFYASLWSDPEVVRYIGKGITRTKEEALKSFQEWLLPGYREGRGLYLIMHKGTQKPIGHAGIVQQMIDGKKEFEIGYWLSREYWGQGYATEAATFFKHYGIEELKLNRLICLIQQRNEMSVSVAVKLGMNFQKETTFNAVPVNVYAWESNN